MLPLLVLSTKNELLEQNGSSKTMFSCALLEVLLVNQVPSEILYDLIQEILKWTQADAPLQVDLFRVSVVTTKDESNFGFGLLRAILSCIADVSQGSLGAQSRRHSNFR